jgi:hypothetical protein
MEENTKTNISFPLKWKEDLVKLARRLSFQQDETITYLDLIRTAIREKYDFTETRTKYSRTKDQ